MWRTALTSKNPYDLQLFKEVRNRYTQAVKNAKSSFNKQKIASCGTDTKKFWDTIKSMECKNAFSQLPNALRFQNIVTTNKPTIIENLNKHFAMVGHAFHLVTSTTVINPTIDMPSLSPPSNSFAHIQTADVLRELQNLDPLKSAGIFF